MPTFRTGVVKEVRNTSPDGVQDLTVDVDGSPRRAVLFPRWTAPAKAGDSVVLNTTAVDLELGTGGNDFVVWNTAVTSYDAPSGGHIMKLRYTPGQCDVLAVESPESPHHEVMANARSLDGAPVVAISLHSQLVPLLTAFRRSAPDAVVAFVMTDGAALEAGFSHTLRALRDRGWLRAVITAGHAVGGDYEAVTVHSGLLAAKHVVGADVIIAGIGPGVVGTATPFGTTAIDFGTIAFAAQALGGRSVVCVRLSDGDPRPRHRGVSHHMVAALGWVATGIDTAATCLVVPDGWQDEVASRIGGWRIEHRDAGEIVSELEELATNGLSVSHMGRGPSEDPLFYEAAAAAGVYASELVR